MNTKGLIDNKNRSLWSYLSERHKIEVCKGKGVEYSAYSKSGKTIIYVPDDNLDSASFTHELLHVFLRTKDVFIGGGLRRSVMENQSLSKIFSDELIEHVGNCLDHVKMLPEFLKLGYPRETFLTDYYAEKLLDDDITTIKKAFKTNLIFTKVYHAKAVDIFIGKFFAAAACPNDYFNYKPRLEKLREIDSELFEILEAFFNSWLAFDYNDTDPITGSYHMILFDFLEGLEKWIMNKKII